MDVAKVISRLHGAAPVVGPSLLACDFGNLEREIRRVEDGGAKVLHLDIMDGHFVPNLSFGIPVVEAIRRATELPLDVHLMISEPERYYKQFIDAGADLLTFHIEVIPEPIELLEKIRSLGVAAGLSLNPPTPVESVEPFLDYCDLLLVMSVMPGFGGQKFDPGALRKLQRIDQLAGRELLLSVDGGVNSDTIGACAQAGARMFVTGTALFSHEDYSRRIEELTSLARS